MRRFPFHRSTLALLILLVWGADAGAQAQPAGPPEVRTLKPTVVSASRSEQSPDELPVTIDLIGREQIEARQMQDIRDLVSDLPNVSVERGPVRFGVVGGAQTGRAHNAGFNIRGLDGNRVLLLVDGIRQPRTYGFQNESSLGRDYFDLSLYKRVEIVRGPASALYGSDGVGGLVNFITKDPFDFIGDGARIGGQGSIGYSGDRNGWQGSATVAGRASDTLGWLLSASAGRADELDNMATHDAPNATRTRPNPQRDTSAALLGKLVFAPDGATRHALTLEHVDKRTDYNLLSNVVATAPTATSVVAANGTSDMARDRLTYDGRWQVNTVGADELRAVLGYQDARSTEYAFQDRFTAVDRFRSTDYGERALQGSLQASKLVRTGADQAHRITYGLDYLRSEVRNLQTGTGVADAKRFPDTTESSAALFVHDEFVAGAWTFTPGLRLDRFDIDASQAGFAGTAVSLSGSALSPKLGAMFHVSPQWSVYGNFASGFRAPTAGQVNAYFENLAGPGFYYRTLPNPNLRPEKSRNVEVGVKGRFDRLTLEAAAFAGRFKDFIEDLQPVSGSGTSPADPQIYQAVNLGKVHISGFEIKGRAHWGQWAGGSVSTPFAYGRTQGYNVETGAPLNSIVPARLSVGAVYEQPSWSSTFTVNHYAAKARDDISGATQFATPAATVLDWSAQWRLRRDLRLNVGIYNLTDRKYWRWSDVLGQTTGAASLDAFTQPGRYARVSIVKDF